MVALTGKDVPFVWIRSVWIRSLRPAWFTYQCTYSGFSDRDRQYILDTDASNFGLGSVLRVMCSVWLLIIVILFDPQRDGIAPLNERCWLLWLCVSSSGCIWLALNSLFVQILGLVASLQGHGWHDGPVVVCPVTVPVFREFQNGPMKSLCSLLVCTKTRTAPYHPESEGMIELFNQTCLMMLSMFVNDRRDNWHELLPYVMHAYKTNVHQSNGYSPFRLMMGEECSLPQEVSTAEFRANREQDIAPHPFDTWVRDALEVAYDHVR